MSEYHRINPGQFPLHQRYFPEYPVPVSVSRNEPLPLIEVLRIFLHFPVEIFRNPVSLPLEVLHAEPSFLIAVYPDQYVAGVQ